MSRPTQTLLGLALLALALLARGWFEASPMRHMLMQYPLLVFAGWLIAAVLMRFGTGDWNRGGAACLLAALFAMAFWMLPLMVDASVASLSIDLAKSVVLAVIAGGGLRLGWPRAHGLARAFLKANAISMLGILAFLYTHAPVRLCNSYLLEDQQRLGEGFLIAAIVLSLLWTFPLIAPPPAPPPGTRPKLVLSKRRVALLPCPTGLALGSKLRPATPSFSGSRAKAPPHGRRIIAQHSASRC